MLHLAWIRCKTHPSFNGEIKMKLTKETLKQIIMEEMQSIVSEADEEVGSFYETPAGARWDQQMGLNGLMEELEKARDPILKIKSVAEECAGLAAGDEDSFAIDQKSNELFTKMIEICDNLLETMQYNVFLQFEIKE